MTTRLPPSKGHERKDSQLAPHYPLTTYPPSCNDHLLVNCIHNNAMKQTSSPIQWLENISFSCSHIFGLAGVWLRRLDGVWQRLGIGQVQESLFLLSPVGWQSCFFPWQWQKHRGVSPSWKAHVKPQLVSYLLTSVYQSPKSRVREI